MLNIKYLYKVTATLIWNLLQITPSAGVVHDNLSRYSVLLIHASMSTKGVVGIACCIRVPYNKMIQYVIRSMSCDRGVCHVIFLKGIFITHIITNLVCKSLAILKLYDRQNMAPPRMYYIINSLKCIFIVIY